MQQWLRELDKTSDQIAQAKIINNLSMLRTKFRMFKFPLSNGYFLLLEDISPLVFQKFNKINLNF